MEDKFFGSTNETGVSQMDNLIAMSDLESVMKQIYGENWKEIIAQQGGVAKSGGLSELGDLQRVTTSQSLKKHLIPEFTIPGTSTTVGKKDQYTTTAAFPFSDATLGQNIIPGGGQQYYQGTGTGTTEEGAINNAKQIAALRALNQPGAHMTESPVSSEGMMDVNSPGMSILKALFETGNPKTGGMPGMMYGGLGLMGYLLANSMKKGKKK